MPFVWTTDTTSHWGRSRLRVATGCITVLGTTAFAANLTVTVENITENKGKVHVVIYDAANWLASKPEKFAGSQSVDITEHKGDGPLVTDVELEPGEYGAFVYHDRNANFKFDKHFIGLPKEPYAFSGPFTKLGCPSSKNASLSSVKTERRSRSGCRNDAFRLVRLFVCRGRVNGGFFCERWRKERAVVPSTNKLSSSRVKCAPYHRTASFSVA